MTIRVIKSVCNIAIIFFTATSCVNQIDSELVPGKIPIIFSTKISHSTTRLSESAFYKGDRVGLFALLHSTSLDGKRYIDNMWLECGDDRTTFIPEKTVFYPEGNATLDFVSYYPYEQQAIDKGKSSATISVKSDQNTIENHCLSDFLVANSADIKSSSQNVELNYQHKLVKLKVTLIPQKGENATELLKANPYLVATGFKTKASYDFNTNSFSDLENESDIIPYGEWSINKDGNLTGKEIIIIPQEIKSENQAFTIEWNGKVYTCPIPTLNIEGSNQCEITITAKENANLTLSGISGKIEAWKTVESGTTQNGEDITEIHLASLSFYQSDVYRIYYEGKAITEICKEYLKSEELTSRAIVAYPIDENDNADLTQGTVLQFLDINNLACGGKICWSTAENTFTYSLGDQASISKFYLTPTGEISVDKPDVPISVNIVSHTIRDIRGGVLQSYPIVKIGIQYWMKSNLQATNYRDGSAIPLKTALGNGPGYFKPSNQDVFFYNGEAVLQGELAPESWRIAQMKDWKLLQTYVGDCTSLLKSGTWEKINDGDTLYPATNEAGLSILPNGLFYIKNGITSYVNKSSSVAYWVEGDNSSSLSDQAVQFKCNTSTMDIEKSNLQNLALSIRCIKE